MDTNNIREAMTHELKCHPEPFAAVKSGAKPFEWRKDDRDYRVGDTLHLREWDPTDYRDFNSPEQECVLGYTGREVFRKVTYIIRDGFGISQGYCIMGLAELDKAQQAAGLTLDEVMKCVDDEAWTARDRIEDDAMSGITDHITKMVSGIHARLTAAIEAKP